MIPIIAAVVLIAFLLSMSDTAFASTGEVNESGVTVYRSDGTLTGAQITADTSSWPGDDAIWNICAAIALAEGYNRGSGYVPYDLNNPGDLSDGANTYGSQSHSGSEVTTFPTAEIGWQWLRDKVTNIVTGKSYTYPASLTWAQVATKWAGNSGAWVNNVTNYLGVEINSTPAEYVNKLGGAGGGW